MSLPKRPDSTESPIREQKSYPKSPSRRREPQDEETGYFSATTTPISSSRHQRRPSKSSFPETIQTPLTPTTTTEPLAPQRFDTHGAGGEMNRKRSLIRPERNKIDRNHPNYYYRQHAVNMNVLPSSTGNDPIMEDLEADAAATESSGLRTSADSDVSPPQKKSRRGHGAGPEDMTSTEKAGTAARSRT